MVHGFDTNLTFASINADFSCNWAGIKSLYLAMQLFNGSTSVYKKQVGCPTCSNGALTSNTP